MTKEHIRQLEVIAEEIGYANAVNILNVLLHRSVENAGVKPKTVAEISRYMVKLEHITPAHRAEMLRTFQSFRKEVETVINKKY
jgi:hypothetical protein